MKSTGIVRNIDELGRIVIPKEIRTTMGIAKLDPVEISVDGDKIIVTKYCPNCSFCQGEAEVIEFKGRRICKDCLNELKGLN